jgi:hypothetical protein
MHVLRERLWFRGSVWVLGFLAATTVLTAVVRPVLPWQKVCPDFICFWTAGQLLRAGASPYNVAEQTRVQHQYGWDKATDGAGRYDFMPYYYPPWLGLLCVPLLPLGYETARLVWFVLQIELLVLSGYLLRSSAPGLPRWGTLVLAPLFILSLLAAFLGQVTPLMLFLIAAAWQLLERRWDRSAGWMLAGLMTKPQLTLALVPAVLWWSIKQRRWGTVQGFLVGLGVLGLAGACLVPDWPLQMLQAPKLTPLVSTDTPWMSTTWYSLWRTVGLQGWALGGMYALGAVAMVGLLVGSIRDRACRLGDVFGLGILAAFFIAPYARAYDQAVLIVPLILLAGRVRPMGTMMLLVVCIVLPAVQLCLGSTWGPEGREVKLFWPPLLLAVLWFVSRLPRFRQSKLSPEDDSHPPRHGSLSTKGDSQTPPDQCTNRFPVRSPQHSY